MINSQVPKVLPEGTTHFCPAFGRYPNRAFKLNSGDQWSYWTGFNWHQPRQSPPPSIRREMIDVRPKRTGPSTAELIEQGYLAPLPFKCTAAPVWNGPEDGLPPVGLEVEVLWSCIKGEYVTCKIMAHDEGHAVYRFTTGERKGEYQADKLYFFNANPALSTFRPIRTAEQLAAEAREKWAEELFDRLYPGFGWKNCVPAIQDRYRAEYDFRVQP